MYTVLILLYLERGSTEKEVLKKSKVTLKFQTVSLNKLNIALYSKRICCLVKTCYVPQHTDCEALRSV